MAVVPVTGRRTIAHHLRIAKIVLALTIVVLVACGGDANANTKVPKCDKKCRQANDRWLRSYDDYFINDSDGGKDFIFAVYHKVPFLDGDQRVVCDVLKSFDAEGVGIAVVCPNGRVINGTGSNGLPPPKN